MRTGRRITVAGLVLGLAALIPGSVLAVVPVTGVPPALTPVTINASAGDQTDPHVSGDWAAYSSDTSIRYFNFTSGVDAEIPPGSSYRDMLSDVSGSKIAFARIVIGKTAIMVFDAASPALPPVEIDPVVGSTRLGSAIGGSTVAYADYGLQVNGELVIHDLVSGLARRITFDTEFDQNPSVSPDGNVVVWEHCATSMTNCDIYQAVKSFSTWTVSIAAATANAEANPDTNGDILVYDSVRAGNGDVFWRGVSGAGEEQLELPGTETNPSIAGQFVTFESRATPASATDIFVYDIVNNRLYQITDTPLVNEQLNDSTVLPDGRLRAVWASDEDGIFERNIHGATFRLADSVLSRMAALIARVRSFNLKQGITNSLDAKLQNIVAALNAANAGDKSSACNKFGAFINEVNAQSGKALTTTEANQLIADATQIMLALGCP